MRRTAVAIVVALVIAATLTTGFVLGRNGDDTTSVASEPSSDGRDPALSTPVPPSARPVPPPEPIQADAAWDGPVGTMRRTGGDEVALTFDDGPDPAWTPKVLAKLADFGVHATFCVIGKEAKAHPDLIRDIVDAGHTLCNHSWKHDLDLGKKSAAKIRDDLLRTNEAIHEAVPEVPIGYYRQPGGNWNERIVAASLDLGMVPVHWTVDPSDWDKSVKAAGIEKEVCRATTAGSIVLMHDGGGDRSRTFSALNPILTDLTARFTLIPLPQPL